MLRRPERCPRCEGITLKRIFYGAPTDDTFEAVKRGEATLGGCMVARGHPDWECQSCRHRWADMTDPARVELDEIEERLFSKWGPAIDLDSYYEYGDGNRVELDRSWVVPRHGTLIFGAEFAEEARPYTMKIEGAATVGAPFTGSIKPRRLPPPEERSWDHKVPVHLKLAEMTGDSWIWEGTAVGEPDGSNDYPLKVVAFRKESDN